MLSCLDICEDYPNLYDRKKITVVMNDDTSLECRCYFLVNHQSNLLSQPFIADYRSDGAHGKPYDPELDEEYDDYSDVQTPVLRDSV